MKRLKLFLLCLAIGVGLIGCKSKMTRVQEQLDLGSKYMEELDYESAIAALNKAIQIDPKNVDAYTMLAEVYEKSGRVDEAKEVLERALGIETLAAEKKDEINKRIQNLEFLVMISEAPGEYDEPKMVELSNINNYDIYYTIETKESRLLATDLKYIAPILLDEDGSYIVKAYTVDSEGKGHDELEVKYTIKLAKEHVEKNSWENVGDIYRYRGEDGKIITGWKEIDGSWYYFTDNGNMATGIIEIDGEKYCFDEDGVMLTGWKEVDGKWYYLGDDGVIRTGSQDIEGKTHYFDDKGELLTGWQKIGEKWYYLTDSGELSIGWKEIDGKWYYFADDGEMKTDQYIDGYYIGADGVRTDILQNPVPPSKKYTDQFSINSNRNYCYENLELAIINSKGPVIDRGNFYEVQNTVFNVYHKDMEDAGDFFPVFTTTIYIRKNAILKLHLYNPSGGFDEVYKTAEQCYIERGGKFWYPISEGDEGNDILRIDGNDGLEIDRDGYFTKLNDFGWR